MRHFGKKAKREINLNIKEKLNLGTLEVILRL